MQDSGHSRWISGAVDRYESALVRYAAHLTGNVELARDAVQDTFLKLCGQSPESLDGHLAQWLYTVCRNRALDLSRKERRMKTMSAVPIEGSPAMASTPSAIIENQESTDLVFASMSRLTEKQREAVRLKFQSGLSYREIAGVMELSVSNVGVLLHTALKKLRQEMAEGDLS